MQPRTERGTILKNNLFQGITICCTGIRNERVSKEFSQNFPHFYKKVQLHEYTQWMGGNCSTDLTDAVTHIVAVDTTTEKYKVTIFVPTGVTPLFVDVVRFTEIYTLHYQIFEISFLNFLIIF